MPEPSIRSVLSDHPRTTSLLFVCLLALTQVGSVAAASATTLSGP